MEGLFLAFSGNGYCGIRVQNVLNGLNGLNDFNGSEATLLDPSFPDQGFREPYILRHSYL
jgi:hypothetical protein